MARKASGEGRRLLAELLVLETSTLVVPSASATPAPSMKDMIADLRETLTALTDAEGEPSSFSDLSDAAKARAQTAGRPAGQHVLARAAGYGAGLHEIIDRVAGGDAAKVDDSKLAPKDAELIRRAWEMARDPVDLTTRVWLEHGDVMSALHCLDGRPPPELVAFHGDMVRVGLDCWGELIRLVSQFLATLISTIVRRVRTGSSVSAAWAAGQRHKTPPPAAPTRSSEGVRERTQQLFGIGGKLFLTDAPDGTHGGIRTLVQLDGDIITRITPESLQAQDLLAKHQATIEAWLTETNVKWARFRNELNWGATGLSGAFLATDLATMTSWHLVAGLAVPLLPVVLRRGFSIATRRLLLRVDRGKETPLLTETREPASAGLYT